MHQKFDITLKDLLKDIPDKFLKILTGYEEGRFPDVQFPLIHYRQPDLIIETKDGTIIHIEIQSTNDGTMLSRMYIYSAFIYYKFKKLPVQVVLYVGNKPMRMANRISDGHIPFFYNLVNIKDIDCKELLSGTKPEDSVLSILCKTQDIDGTIKRILDNLSVLPQRQREDYIKKLLILSDLRNLSGKIKKEVKKMPITMNVKKSWIFKEGRLEGKQEGKLEGIQEGKQEGRLEGLIEGIELGLELKYGSEGLELMDMAGRIGTVDRLAEFKELIKKSCSVDELKVFLKGNA
ncbi:MAG: hypothetical protein HQK89_08740 [Nitrospirae bacterium]|nr:hypothetical protein [Nitrospirota bacterium]